MEDILILLLQALGEFLLEIFAWWPWDYFWWWGPWDRNDRTSPSVSAALISLATGAALGWLSLFIFPAVLVKWAWLRIALLVISPLGSGLMSFHFARGCEKEFEYVDPVFHFWIGFCFSIGFVWVRFALADRPG